MDQGDLGRVLVKITGLIFIAYALTGLPQYVELALLTLSDWQRSAVPGIKEAIAMPQFWCLSLVPFIISLALGLGLFRGGGLIVDRFVVRSQSDGTTPTALRAIEEIAIVVLGLYFFVDGLARTTQWIAGELANSAAHHLPFGNSIWPAQVGFVSGAGARLFVGVVLMLGSRGFVALRRRVASFRRMSGHDAT